jgi:hypothetical protein
MGEVPPYRGCHAVGSFTFYFQAGIAEGAPCPYKGMAKRLQITCKGDLKIGYRGASHKKLSPRRTLQ